MCVYLYIQINYTHYTHIYYIILFWMRLIIAHPYMLGKFKLWDYPTLGYCMFSMFFPVI